MKDDTAKIWKAMKLQHRAEKAHRCMTLGLLTWAGSFFVLRIYLGYVRDPDLAADRTVNLIFACICAIVMAASFITAIFNFFAAADADEKLEILYDKAELLEEGESKNTGMAN